MTTLKSPSYATPETLTFQAWHKQKQRRVRKSHNPSFIVSYPYVTNYMPSPFDPSGYTVLNDPDCTYNVVQEQNPSGAATAGEISAVTGFASVNLPAAPTGLNILAGESVFLAMPVRATDDFKLFYRFDGNGGQLEQNSINVLSATTTGNINITDIGDWKLIQVRHTVSVDSTNMRGWFFVSVTSGVVDPFYVQATYFGKADDFPANVMPTL